MKDLDNAIKRVRMVMQLAPGKAGANALISQIKKSAVPSVPIIVGHEVEIKSEGVEGFGDV
jgi:hypothetical protein